MGVKPLGEDCF